MGTISSWSSFHTSVDCTARGWVQKNTCPNSITLFVAEGIDINSTVLATVISDHPCCLQDYVPLPKSSSKERIISNSQLFDFELSTEDVEHLDSLDEGQSLRLFSETGSALTCGYRACYGLGSHERPLMCAITIQDNGVMSAREAWLFPRPNRNQN